MAIGWHPRNLAATRRLRAAIVRAFQPETGHRVKAYVGFVLASCAARAQI